MDFQPFFNDFFFFHFAELFLSIYLLAYISYAVIYGGSQTLAYPTLLNSTSSFTIFILSAILLAFGSVGSNFSYNLFHGATHITFFSFMFRTLLIISSLFLLIICKDYLSSRGVIKYEYDLLLVFSILSLIILGCSDDFLVIYLAIELQSLCFYVLATFQRNSEFSTEAGLKYFVLGAFSSGLLLFGFTLIYITFGTTSFEALAKLVSSSNNVIAFWGFLFVLAAFFFKLGAAPFHMWLCDVYEGCLTSVTAFFAAVPKLILFSVLIKLSFYVFSEYNDYTSILLIIVGILSVCLASVAALYQKRVKRLLAYSTISHTGFILLGIACGSIDSVKSCVIYIALYALMSLSTFSLIMFAGMKKTIPKYLINWTALAQRNMTLAITFTLILFSIAGIPPLAGFYSKLCILLSMLSQDLIFLTLVVVMFSSIACFYYIRLIKVFFFTKTGKNNFWSGQGGRSIELFLGFSTTLIVLFLCRPSFLNTLATVVATSLL
jgi:NADH-quinone oxidoreductase subunit N